MPMYNFQIIVKIILLSSSLYNYYKDEVNDDVNENNVDSCRIDSSKTLANVSPEYKAKTIVSTLKIMMYQTWKIF